MQNDRIRQIMTILLQEKKVIAKELASRFGVSLESIRRDLSELERQGTVRKFYGGAALVEDLLPDGEAEVFQVRLTEHGAEKQAIARAVAALIGDGETIYLDSGTTTGALLPLLKERQACMLYQNLGISSSGKINLFCFVLIFFTNY